MNTKELAVKLSGIQYPCRILKDLIAEAVSNRLVIVFGASDDLMEFRGAICDEAGCYDGGYALVDGKGLLPEREQIEDDGELEDYFKRKRLAHKITAVWCPPHSNISWEYETTIPHDVFEVVEDGDIYCLGIVFSLDHLGCEK